MTQPPPLGVSVSTPPPLLTAPGQLPGDQPLHRFGSDPSAPTIVRVDLVNRAIDVPALNFGCSAKNVPHPMGSAADAVYVGAVSKLITRLPVYSHPEGVIVEQGLEVGEMTALFAAALAQRTMMVIVRPMSGPGPSYWLRIPLAGAEIATVGQQGIIKKRPNVIAVTAIDGAVGIGCREVKRYWPNREAMQPWKEADMLAELLAQQRR